MFQSKLPNKLIVVIFIYFFGLLAPLLGQDKIVRIDFGVMGRTDPEFLQQFLTIETGATLDSAQIVQDVQTLRNLKLFSDVTFTVSHVDSGKVITFYCQELVTVLPISNFGGISGNFWFQLGVNDFNWRGRGNTIGGYYRYYDRHSVEGYLNAPYLFGAKWGLFVGGNKLATIEPTEIEGQYVAYNVDRWSIIGSGRFSLSFDQWLQFGGGYLHERFEKNLDQSGDSAPGPDRQIFDKFLLKGAHTVDLVDYYFQYLDGFLNELTIESVITKGQSDMFWKILNITRWYKKIRKRGNLAFRLRLGISQNKNSPFVPFVLDSYITVRGSGNRVSRGTAELTANSEYRHTLTEKKWGAMQAVAFVDWSAWRTPGGNFATMFENQNNVTFAGLGLRLYFRKVHNLILRVDYGLSVTHPETHGVVFGTGHYF